MGSEYRRRTLSRRRFIELTGLSALAAACAPAPGPSSATGTTPASTATSAATSAALGKPEKTAIKFGMQFPNLTFQAPALIAIDKGFYRDAGFSDVQIVTTEQVSAGVIGGGVDFGIENFLNLADSFTKGTPERMIGIWRTYELGTIAVRPEILSVKDLDGKDIILASVPGSPDVDRRKAMLKAAGWDLSTVRPNIVTAAGGSDAWVRLFLDKKIWMTPIFNRHRPAVAAAGGKLVVDSQIWGNDVLAATATTIQQSPNTVAQFLAATVKGMRFFLDVKNQDYVIDLGSRKGFPVGDDVKAAYPFDLKQYDSAADGGWDVGEMTKFLTSQLPGKTIDPKSLTVVGPLNLAQQSLGLKARPTS